MISYPKPGQKGTLKKRGKAEVSFYKFTFRCLNYDDSASFLQTKKKSAAIGEIILSLAFHNICV